MPTLAVELDGFADVQFPMGRWLGEAEEEDEALLDLAVGPVIDVGCGPGRHVHALGRRGIPAMGVDITPSMVSLARRRGLAVLQRSVFGHIPGQGRWGTVLLLDGNIGIGADPLGLLTRVTSLLRPGGRVLAELDGPQTDEATGLVRLDCDGHSGPWFGWSRIGADRVESLCPPGLVLNSSWSQGSRWFARLDRV